MALPRGVWSCVGVVPASCDQPGGVEWVEIQVGKELGPFEGGLRQADARSLPGALKRQVHHVPDARAGFYPCVKAMVEALLPCFPVEPRRHHEGHHADRDMKADLVIRPVKDGPYPHEVGILHLPKRMLQSPLASIRQKDVRIAQVHRVGEAGRTPKPVL